jgi:mycothione reductase
VSRRIRSYDLLVIGTGSAMNIVEPMVNLNPRMKIAIVDKDDPGVTRY